MTDEREWIVTLYITTTYTRCVTTDGGNKYSAESDAVAMATSDWGRGEPSIRHSDSWVSEHDIDIVSSPEEEI